MNEIPPKSKMCPSCRRLTPPEKQVKKVSRSSGKQTITMRCLECSARMKKFL